MNLIHAKMRKPKLPYNSGFPKATMHLLRVVFTKETANNFFLFKVKRLNCLQN